MSDSSYGSVYVEGVTYIDEREIAKRDAEIERLREGERAADAEIERLRGENDALKDEVELKQSALTGTSRVMGEEIERLREENSTFSDSLAAKADRIDRLGETVARQVAEIERLREWQRQMVEKAADKSLAGYRELAQKLADKDEEIERLRGEATQLRQALGMLTTLHPTMEIDVNNPMQMAKEIVSYVTESRDTEIERLRGALEAITVVGFDDGAAGRMAKIALRALRVREALGE